MCQVLLTISKCRKIGGHCPSDVEWRAQMTPAFFLQTKKGHGFSRFSGKRNAVCYACRSCRSCGPTSAPQVCPIFLPLIYPPTRSTLRDNRIQRERWGNYTIFTLRAAKRDPFRLFRRHSIQTVAVPLGNAAFPVRQAVLSGAFCACFSCQYLS